MAKDYADTFALFGKLRVYVVTSTPDSIKRMAAQNIGFGLVPRLCIGQEATGILVKTIAEFAKDRELWMV
jgi:DNA-binding transcriptional LysR family regulator